MYYFDHSATTKPHKEVLETFVKVNEEFYSNPASIHKLGVEAHTLLSRARKQVADMVCANRLFNGTYFLCLFRCFDEIL